MATNPETLTIPKAAARKYLGRRIVEPTKQPRWRSQAQRDHDRLMYSSAFQRLGGITQVSAPELGRPFHTRLTHTLKVAQVARRLAERLHKQLDPAEKNHLTGPAAKLVQCLDIDAAESAALAHDLGHPPFGHLAEKVLDRKARDAGGFEGNPQSFRIVTRLALRKAVPGLDLTRQTLNGILKYPWLRSDEHPKRRKKWGAYSSDEETFKNVRKHSPESERSLEACIMDWADDVTYAVHDLDDFARAGLIPLDQLATDEREQQRFKRRLKEELEPSVDDEQADRLLRALNQAISFIDLDGNYEERPLQRVGLRSFGSMLITRYIEAFTIEDSGKAGRANVVIDPAAKLQVEALKQLTMLYVVRRPSLAVVQRGQAHVVECLWDWYEEATRDKGDVRLLPPAYRVRLAEAKREADPDTGRIRLVTDLVAGMTETAASELYKRMAGMTSGSILDATAHAT
jgi:dGTPase